MGKLKTLAILLIGLLIGVSIAWAVNTYVLQYPSTAQGLTVEAMTYNWETFIIATQS